MTKNVLSRYCWIMKEIGELEDQLFQVETRATSTNCPMKKDIVTGSQDMDMVSGHVALMCEIKNQINEKVKMAYWAKREIENIIGILNSEEQKIFRLRYTECKKWEDVSDQAKDTLRNIHRIHSAGIIKLTKKHYI